jgi:ubiquinone/menaquinone biosynthesis C-methylase UbiE
LRQGEIGSLPFNDQAFDTIILNDVLDKADDPRRALNEARRLLRPGGRILVLVSVGNARIAEMRARFSDWAAATGLRLSPPRPIPNTTPVWLLAVATTADSKSAAA